MTARLVAQLLGAGFTMLHGLDATGTKDVTAFSFQVASGCISYSVLQEVSLGWVLPTAVFLFFFLFL